MMEAGIKRQSYFKKIFDMAESQRVIKKTNDRCGRVVVMLIPSGVTPLPIIASPLKGEGYIEGGWLLRAE